MSYSNMHKASIAPMMQYTDMHDRYLLRLISKKVFLYTEMVTTGAILYGKCFHQLEFNKEEHPVAIQLGGSDVDDLVKSAKIAEDYGYDEINLNVGCPSDRVQKGRFGACLMLEPEHVAECLNAMQTNVKVPVTIKCRLGVDHHEDYEFLYNFVNIVQDAGIKHFIIHARNGILKGLSPRQNRHIPPLKYDYVYQLKKDFSNLNITINGGIKTIDECKDHLKYVDGVMIGRAAYENPFLIKDIDTELYGIESNINSKKSILNQYLDYVEDKLQEGHDLSRMMKHLFGLSRGDKFAKTFRIKILEVIKKESLGQHRKELEDLLIY
ncbi:MAG: tRNA dihydrouridine(20/20a) synthase DusA [Proteobacteria bacterium]|nr:tRNA dihydrouridine(20/20a) synthase DusA [Pseudomonadota bacterium]NCV45670.1 tRNA dihydrouridine(20/20a) synthase DusA [Pseudomonadota bacterium]NCW10825.1 tRNA dihydrouridine(20/20a) synthase DusA [Pseudomonadota bacterium]NCW37812.1 tRNA dihydrouridine(20/20a) synthase DusA [Pseudomonadota bacterium]NCX74514.1 tRNA dihydrouridine(20/20a) synthase DusA [Pseudomonadota bacterium]